jgi:uncharacterized protein (DUF1697 family)
MERYAAFLRGVTPMNAKMAELKSAFELAGFADVKTVLSSGNVVFGAPATPEEVLERRAETAMTKRLGHAFPTIVRRVEALRKMLASGLRAVPPEPGSKRVSRSCVEGLAPLVLLIELEGARILLEARGEVFSAYVPSPRGPCSRP